MEKKVLQKTKEQQLEIKTPLDLFRFIDEYYESMDSESRLELLGEVEGVHILSISDKDLSLPELSLPEYKYRVARIFKDDFKKETRDPRPIILDIVLDGAPDWLLKPLSRPTTPEQLEYLTWLVNAKDLPSDNNDSVNKIPDHAKEYLKSCGVEV